MKAQASTHEEQFTAQLGVKDAEISKIMSQCKEFEERMHVAEQSLAKNEKESLATFGDEEASKKRISTLQTQVDLLTSEKESMTIKLKEFEVELRETKSQASVNEERLGSELESAKAAVSKLQEGIVNIIEDVELRLAVILSFLVIDDNQSVAGSSI